MTESLSNWLALREAADVAARSATLTRATVDALSRHNRLDILDLGTGTGSNLRYLAGRHPALLAEAPARTSSWGAANGYAVTIESDQFAIRGRHMDCCVATRRLDLG